MAHDDYYNNLQKSADERLQKATHAVHEPTNCTERYEQLAHLLGGRIASAIEAFVDARMAHHELHENKA